MNRRRFRKWVYLAILLRQKMVCACGCRERMTRAEGFAADHIVPLWAGGADSESNLQFLRDPCHKAKTKREAFERAKADRIRAKLNGEAGPRGGKRCKAKIQSRGFDTRFRKKLTGEVVAR